MSALTIIFNHLYVYLIVIVNFVFNSDINTELLTVEQVEILMQIVEQLHLFFPEMSSQPPDQSPILLLSFGVFACGSIICLVRRLMR